MAAITIPNLGQAGAPGIPLPNTIPQGVPLSPAAPAPAQPMPSSPAPTPAAPSAPSQPQISPLYQQFMDSAGQSAQLAKSTQAGQSATPTPQRGWIQDLLGPELTGLVSAGRSLEATPDVLSAVGDAITGDKVDEQMRLEKANATMKKSVGGVRPLADLNNEEALGLAAQTAGQGAMVLGAPAIGVGLQSAGNAMQSDKGPVQVIIDGLVGAVAGKVGDAILPVLGNAAGAAYDAVVPEAAKTAIGGLADSAGSALQSLGNKISPTLAKLIPDKATSDILTPLLNKISPTISKLFVSSADAGADDALSTYLSGLKKAVNLRTTLGQEMDDLSGALTEQFPDAKINLNASQVQAIKTAAEKAGIALPKFLNAASSATIAGEDVTAEIGEKLPGVDLTISQAQELGTSLNQAYGKGYIENVYDDLRQTVRTSLNNAQPGLGTVYDQMYQTASQGYTALDSLDDIFNTKNKSLNASDLNNAIAKIQELASKPQGGKILSTVLDNFKATTGVDLSSEVEAVNAAGNIKDPLARRAANVVINLLKQHGGAVVGGALGAYEIWKHG